MPVADNTTSVGVNLRYRGLYRRTEIPSCIVGIDDLKKIAEELGTKAREALDDYLQGIERPADQTQEAFDAALQRVRSLEPMVVYVVGGDGEQIVGPAADVFVAEKLPDRIQSIAFDSSTSLQQVNVTLAKRFQLFLDLSEPPMFYGYQPWEQPTPNGSHLEVTGPDTTWATAVHDATLTLLKHRRTWRGWLHSPTTFNIFQWVVGWPASLWLAFWADAIGQGVWGDVAVAWRAAFVIYVMLLGLLLFRVVVSGFRWLFPVVELKGTRTWKTRLGIGALLSSPVVGLVVAILRALL